MIFQMASRRYPVAELRELLGRVAANNGRPVTPVDIRAVYGDPDRRPGPDAIVTREDMDRVYRERFPARPRPGQQAAASAAAGSRRGSGSGYGGGARQGGEDAVRPGPGNSDTKFARFFSAYSEPIEDLAARRGIDPTLLLGLSALESTWGESRMAREQNNPFGATPRGDRSGGVRYPSVEDAWDVWDSEWGARLENVGSDEQRFVDALLQDNRSATDGVDRRGAYNSQVDPEGDPDWRQKVLDVIRSVRRRYPEWRASQR